MLDLYMTSRAKRDLVNTVIYIGEVLGAPQAAKGFYKDYQQEMELVRQTPNMGAPFRNPMLENSDYRWVMVGKYRIFYRHDSKAVTVWRIIHCLQDLDEFELIDWAR